MFTCRQNGRSYLGILDDVQGSFSVLNIPFMDIDDIVLPKILCSLSLCAKAVKYLTALYISKLAYLSMQTLGINCLYVEGASEVHPLSVAKLFCYL